MSYGTSPSALGTAKPATSSTHGVPAHHVNRNDRYTEWENGQTLHVAVAYTNPRRWNTRRSLFHAFRRHMEKTDNVKLYVAELAYGDRPFEVTDPDNPRDIQLRTVDELWHKENLLNLAIRKFPVDWQYGAIVDGDLHFTRNDWALEAIHELQHHSFVQLFSALSYLLPNYRPHRLMSSFAYNWLHNRSACNSKLGSPGAVGGAWAFTRDALETVGGLLDTCIVGSGDWHMAFGLAQLPSGTVELTKTPKSYADPIVEWQKRAALLKCNFGCIDNYIVHFWHGSLQTRGYGSRVSVLVNNSIDLKHDIAYDINGVLKLTGSKPKLRDDIREYLRARDEDNLHCPERSIV